MWRKVAHMILNDNKISPSTPNVMLNRNGHPYTQDQWLVSLYFTKPQTRKCPLDVRTTNTYTADQGMAMISNTVGSHVTLNR